MAARRSSRRSERIRIGSVSLYRHHCAWWIYYRQGGMAHRRRVGKDRDEAHRVAAQVNADLVRQQPTLLSFRPTGVGELVRSWLDWHEQVQRSSLATVNRYRTAVAHLVYYASKVQPVRYAHEVQAENFVRHLRSIHVAPNGHAHTEKRLLRGKGVGFILAACRSLYGYANRQRLLPPYSDNPFAALRIERMAIDDPKPVYVFSADEEFRFLEACDAWQLPIFYMLAKLGLRPGELSHLLVDDVDCERGVLHVRNKPELGWHVKTRSNRKIPLASEPMAVLRHVIGGRKAGVLFRRRGVCESGSNLDGLSQSELIRKLHARLAVFDEASDRPLDRAAAAKVARCLWREAGAIRPTHPTCSFPRSPFSRGDSD